MVVRGIMLFLSHISLMTTATLGIVAGVSAAMFFRKKKNWMRIHKAINSLSFTGMAAGIIIAFIYVSSSSGEHINGFHQLIGLSAFIGVLITLLLGFHQFKAKNKPPVRTAHRLTGRFSLLMLVSAVILGLKLINII